MNFFLENLDILSRKFPFLYFLLISKIKTLQKNLIYKSEKNNLKDDIEVLFVYKCAIDQKAYGDIKKWIRDKNKEIHFFDDDLDNIKAFFQTKIANDLLKNENVYFHFFTKVKQLIVQLTSVVKTKKVHVDTFIKESKYFHKLKKEIIQNCLITFFSMHDSIFGYKIFKNFYSNLDKLKSSFLLNKFKNSFKDMPAIVIGAGPSLKYSFNTLKRLQNKALLIAGGSAITCLSNQNILPHLGVIIDPNFDEYERMKKSLSFEIPIVYSTRVNYGVFKTFNGPLGYVRNKIGGAFEDWLDEQLKINDRSFDINDIEKSLTVTTVCLAITKFLGCNPIILDGVDLSFSQNKRYSLDIIEDNKNQHINIENHISKDKNNKEIYTNVSWEIERDCIALFAKENKKIKFINATKEGLKINDIADISLSEVEKKYLCEQFDFRSYIHYLSQKNKIIKKQKTDFFLMKKTLKRSFERCDLYLQDIIRNNPEYKAILAKEEIQEEIAYKYFLLDYDYTMKKMYPDSDNFKRLKEITQLFLLEC